MADGEEMDIEYRRTMPTILCCLCGIAIAPNPANMCVSCIRGQVDISEGVPKQLSLFFCKFCERYLQPPRGWVAAQLESKELLSICLKRLSRALAKVKLVDASFKWTEPHSRRILVRLTIQKEAFHNAILQQEFMVEFVVEHQQCDACKKDAANMDAWQAVVQTRQKVDHKRTFYYLEQVILKHTAHEDALGLKIVGEGIDFYFANKSHALKFINFVGKVAPVRHKVSEHLVSHDANSNVYNYKHTYSLEIAPVCKDDLVCLPLKTSAMLGGIGPLVLITKVSQSFFLVDPSTLHCAELSGSLFWSKGGQSSGNAFSSLLSSKRMTTFVVLDVEISGHQKGRYLPADVTVARSADFGANDNVYYVRSHLGGVLQTGDLCLGYDLGSANFSEMSDLGSYRNLDLPDVILVKKTYERKNRARKRKWKLKQLALEEDVGARRDPQREDAEREYFLQELEQDAELRAGVNLYKDSARNNGEAMTDGSIADGEGDDGYPEVPLEELLEDLNIADPDEDDT